MIPGLDPDPESNFQVFAIPDWDRVKSGNVTLMLSCYDSWLGSGSRGRIFTFLAILNPDSDPIKSGIVTPLEGTEEERDGEKRRRNGTDHL